jgi:hypothetical protein
MKTVLRASILTLTIALVAAACAGADDGGGEFSIGGDAAMSTAAPATTVVAAADEERALFEGDAAAAPESADDGTAGLAAETQAVTTSAANLGRSIIYTATVELEVPDVVAAGAEITNAVAGLGGVLFGQETTTGEFPRSILTIKVPPNRFDDALARLGGVGELISQTIYADDVTERVVDLESRIRTAEVSVERLRTLLEAAANIEDVVELESELVERETDLEVLRGQLRTLEDAVALATIVVILSEPEPDVPMPAIELIQTAYLGHDGGDGCPGAEELTIDEGEPMTVCFVITNTGDTPLGEIVVRDRGLDMDEDDPLVVEGSLSDPLLPGEQIVLAFETEADPDQFTSPGIDATALDEDGEPTRSAVEAEVDDAFLRIIRDTSLPGFMDGLEAAWGALARIVGVLVLAAGAVIPFLWVPVLAGAAWWWRKRRATKD